MAFLKIKRLFLDINSIHPPSLAASASVVEYWLMSSFDLPLSPLAPPAAASRLAASLLDVNDLLGLPRSVSPDADAAAGAADDGADCCFSR